MTIQYVVCNRLIDAETNEHCEFDGDVEVGSEGGWRCPSCRRVRYAKPEPIRNSSTGDES